MTTTKPKPGITSIKLPFYLDQADADRAVIWRCLSAKGRKRLKRDLERRGLPPPSARITGEAI